MNLRTALPIILASAHSLSTAALMAQESSSALGLSVGTAVSHEWVGVRSSGDRSQALVLHIELRPKAHGSVDLPDFGALDIPAANFAMTDGRIHFDLVSDSSTAIFDGKMRQNEIEGHWRENERSGEFRLHPSPQIDSKLEHRSVTFQNGDVRLSGTLLLPQTAAPASAIVFVHGAGPETRQASLFLAEHFAARNIAALVYDKRGTGQSTGDWKRASFEDLASDVEAAVAFLKAQPAIDPLRIGLMGSSQGGWIAPIAATRLPNLAYVIVKSAAAVTPERQELARVEIQMREAGDSPTEIAEAQRLYKNAIAYARSGQGWEGLRKEIEADAKKRWALFPADTPSDYWFFTQIRLFFHHDPLSVLERLRTPVLVVYGGEDNDGPPLLSQLGPLLSAMQSGGKLSQLAIFPSAGHSLRVEPGPGQPWNFSTFAPGYLELLDSWVRDRTATTEHRSSKVARRPTWESAAVCSHKRLGGQ